MNKSPLILTPIQHYVLRAMANDQVMVLHKRHGLIVGRYRLNANEGHALMKAGFLTRLDKERHIKTKGNGYVISELGRAALA